MESTGRKKFEEMYNLTVQTCGLIIDSDIPYLAASLDGLVRENSIIEIKCPYNAGNSESLIEAFNNKLVYEPLKRVSGLDVFYACLIAPECHNCYNICPKIGSIVDFTINKAIIKK